MMETTVSVTELARFCHRSGDIDWRFRPSPTGPEGIAGHQRLYKRRPATYQAEYKVESTIETGGVNVRLCGRADGYDPAAQLVEEIKTCRVAPVSIPGPVSALHFSQGKLYAALIAREENLDGLEVQLTWLNIDTDEEFPDRRYLGRGELDAFLFDTLERYGSWLRQVDVKRNERNGSADALTFPYGMFRDGQRDIAELTYKCIDQSSQLAVEAPTGIGKTAAVIYPALKAMARDKHDKIAFVTAKNIGRLTAEDTLANFRDAGLRASALTLTAKERICFSPGKACHGDDCPYARGYYDKLPACMDSALQKPSLSRQSIEALAREFEVCPYELAQDLLPWIDIVIADLHYVYSLYALLGGAMEESDQRWTLLLDEAHNIPARARDMYSTSIGKMALMRARRKSPKPLARTLDRVNRCMLSLQKINWQSPDFHSESEVPENLSRALEAFTGKVAEVLGSEPTLLARAPDLADFYFDALHFLRIVGEWGPEYRLQLSRSQKKQSLQITLNCLDPSRLLALRQDSAHAVIAFSATLSPFDWARKRLGLGEEAVCTRVDSPFAHEQLNVWLATGVDTRYRQRSVTLPALAGMLQQWLTSTPGNCIVYFPSYQYLEDCLSLLQELPLSREIWAQQPRQEDRVRDQLLQKLKDRDDIAAFCILGGVFGEGIDLPGDQLSSVVVVGVGMPQINRDTRELQAWHEERTAAGFEYTFLYPGMQKVAQAMGRVIRRLEDRGDVLLIDPRYAEEAYRRLLPPWWQYQALPAVDPAHKTPV